ncbi:MAG TPA: hypothetical protein VHC69_12945 [Polyangiaceae bacterium]|nr:hypothetical protein [Polyangiaceae bacterium]
MTPDEEEPTPEELLEAERLARALERGHSPEPVPEDALGAAALLRFSKDGGALATPTRERILEDVLSRAKPSRRRPHVIGTVLGLLGLSAAGAASIALVVRSQSPEPASLPEPPRELLEAQIAAANMRSSLTTLHVETRRYRETFYAKLRERYGK